MNDLTVRDAQRITHRHLAGRNVNLTLVSEIERLVGADGVALKTELDRLAGRFGARALLVDIFAQRQQQQQNPNEIRLGNTGSKPSGNSADGNESGSAGDSQEPSNGVAAGGENAENTQATRSPGQPARGTGTGNGTGKNESVEQAGADAVPAASDNRGSETADSTSETGSAGGAENKSPRGTATLAENPPAADAAERAGGDPQGNDAKNADGDADKPSALTSRANAGGVSSTDNADARRRDAKEAGAPGDATGAEIKFRYRSSRNRNGRNPIASFTENRQFGGITAELKRRQIPPKLVKNARNAISALITGGENAPGPRFDHQNLCVRLLTHRPVQPARREEDGRPAILVMVDVSGSCLGFSNVGLLVAQAVAMNGVAGADIIVVSHSNGYPISVMKNRQEPEPVARSGQDWAAEFWSDIIARNNLRVVIAIGDWDAYWIYEQLVSLNSVRRFVWLSNYCCNYIYPTIANDEIKKYAKFGRDARKVTHVIGCSSADDFITGIHMALRRQ